ncbi:MAG: SPOR domain-containing protein [bacterium]|nr:SPOR domain-containing protein [bacterium]
MFRMLLILAIAATASAQAVKKSPIDLLREGRMVEAQKILNQTDAPERYNMLLDALREPNAIEACFLYREISARFPGTDCDEFAQERLLQAASMGIDISALVLESAQVVDPGQWVADTPETYEVERPLIASVKREEMVDETPVVEEPKLEPQPDPVVEKQVEVEPVEKPKPQTIPASSVTLDYSSVVPAKKDTGFVHSSMETSQSLVKTDEPKAEITPKKSSTEVQPEPTRPNDIDDRAPDGWYIQVGAFGIHDNAHKIASKLRKEGYKVYLVPRDKLMQVRVGAFAPKKKAEPLATR